MDLIPAKWVVRLAKPDLVAQLLGVNKQMRLVVRRQLAILHHIVLRRFVQDYVADFIFLPLVLQLAPIVERPGDGPGVAGLCRLFRVPGLRQRAGLHKHLDCAIVRLRHIARSTLEPLSCVRDLTEPIRIVIEISNLIALSRLAT